MIKILTIFLLFFGDCEKPIQGRLAAEIGRFYGQKVVILKPEDLPVNAYYKANNRYRAELVLNSLPTGDENILGITTEDLSTTAHGIYDWGVMGMGYDGASVMSTHRLKTENQIINVALHELGHSFGLEHCKNKCLMRDAEGKLPSWTLDKPVMCSKCRAKLG